MVALLMATPCVWEVWNTGTHAHNSTAEDEREAQLRLSPGPLAIPQLLSKKHIGPEAQMPMAARLHAFEQS